MLNPRPGVTVTDTGLEVRNRDVISETIVRMDQAGEGFRTPLLRAARDGLLNLVMTGDGDPVPSRALTFQRPTVVLLLDDHPDATGPDRWPQAPKLLRWARRGLFHAAAGDAAHYLAATMAAGISGRLLLVEMQSQHHAAWLDLAKRIVPRLQILNIMPREGVHPIAGAPAGTEIQ